MKEIRNTLNICVGILLGRDHLEEEGSVDWNINIKWLKWNSVEGGRSQNGIVSVRVGTKHWELHSAILPTKRRHQQHHANSSLIASILVSVHKMIQELAFTEDVTLVSW